MEDENQMVRCPAAYYITSRTLLSKRCNSQHKVCAAVCVMRNGCGREMEDWGLESRMLILEHRVLMLRMCTFCNLVFGKHIVDQVMSRCESRNEKGLAEYQSDEATLLDQRRGI